MLLSMGDGVDTRVKERDERLGLADLICQLIICIFNIHIKQKTVVSFHSNMSAYIHIFIAHRHTQTYIDCFCICTRTYTYVHTCIYIYGCTLFGPRALLFC